MSLIDNINEVKEVVKWLENCECKLLSLELFTARIRLEKAIIKSEN